MANRVSLVQTIAGGMSRSNIVKVGLGDSLNMYPETTSATDHSCSILMRSVDGERKFCQDKLAGACRGMYRVSRGYKGVPAVYAVFGDTLYVIDEDGTQHDIAKLYTASSECRMVETGGYGSAHPHLLMVDGLNCYAVDVTVPLASQRADFRTIQLPVRTTDDTAHIRPTHVAYLYNYAIINDEDSDAAYVSIQYPFEVLDANNRIDYDIWRLGSTSNIGYIMYSEWCPDNTTALCSNGSKLYTFGPRSWQAFSYNDDRKNPFSSPDNAAGNIGILAVNSLAMLGHTTIWLGSSDIGESAVFMINDTELRRISTGDLEREIAQVKNPQNAYSSIWQEHRHVFYSLTFEDSRLTYVYDVTEDKWHRRASYDTNNDLTYWRYSHATFGYGKTLVGTNDGWLCAMDETVYAEHDNRKILRMRRGGVLTSDDRPFFVDSAEIVCNNGQHSTRFASLVTGGLAQPADGDLNPRISVRYSWDGATFSDYEDHYLGKVGEYNWSTTLWHMGYGKFLTVEISTTEEVPFAIENLKVNWSPSAMY